MRMDMDMGMGMGRSMGITDKFAKELASKKNVMLTVVPELVLLH